MKYDIALVGICNHFNYGSVLTNFAMYNVVKDLGLIPVMITQPLTSVQKPYKEIWYKYPYSETEVKTCKNKKEMHKLNKITDIFCVTSDQLFNCNSYAWFDRFMLLDWVHNYKKKCTYAASFGHDIVLPHTSKKVQKTMSKYMQKFDIFTVREKSGVALAKESFKVDATMVLDPVFLCNKKHYFEMAANYPKKTKSGICAYLLDFDDKDFLNQIKKDLKMQITIINDYEKDMNNNNTENMFVERWIKTFINSDFIITDSFHGVCFAIIFNKPFIAIGNRLRGITRFDSILGICGLKNRMIFSLQDYIANKKELLKPINYNLVKKKIQPYIEQSSILLNDIIVPKTDFIHKIIKFFKF